ncbi:hypothetical protein GQF42_00585 [Streptomyces broussonetiae]|uniref:Secreted protein n=1 Tax=Streptomyces broussonetiae TaxID=2686304 RepID=A0A6I6MUS5_9ACTN|nr:hypothetical protein [Streptomyces broussonetiae]QHA02059.1 hypothetical protein GQF42_00585 [Streptomyces broussonetiae]
MLSRLSSQQYATAAVAALVLTVFSPCLASCSTGVPAGNPRNHQLGNAPQPQTPAQGQIGDAERKRLFEAEQVLIAHCMSARGWTYRPIPWHPKEDDPAQDPRHGDDVRLHRTAGYGLAAAWNRQTPSPNDSYVNSLSVKDRSRYSRALYGSPQRRLDAPLPNGEVTFIYVDGCTAQSEQQLYGDLKEWLITDTTVINLDIERDNRIGSAPAMARTSGAWSACMKSRGYHYPNPDAARNHAIEAYAHSSPADTREPSRAELAQSTADAECDRQVGRARAFRALDKGYGDQLARERAPQIRAYRELAARALANIRAHPTWTSHRRPTPL